MRRLREDIQLAGSIATIAIAIVALGSWLARQPGHVLLYVLGIAGWLVLLTVGAPKLVAWLRARYREPVSEDRPSAS